MPVKEASSEETPYGRYITSDGWFVLNLGDALAVRNEEKGGAAYPLEPREQPFNDVGVRVRVLWPGDPNALYHSEGVQEGFLVLSGECTLIVEEEERPLRQWDYFHCPADTRHVIVGAGEWAVCDSHDRGASRRAHSLPGERGRGEVRCIRREGDRRTGRGLRRLARRIPADATAVAGQLRHQALKGCVGRSVASTPPRSIVRPARLWSLVHLERVCPRQPLGRAAPRGGVAARGPRPCEDRGMTDAR